jgi:tRNA-modifying protein YgfZ
MAPGEARLALWLDRKGKIMAESWILKDAGSAWWLWSPHGDGAALRARLEEYLIADELTVSDFGAEGWEQHTLRGAAAEGFGPPPAPGTWRSVGGGLLIAGRRGQPAWLDWLLPTAGAEQALAAVGLSGQAAEDEEELTRERLAAGVPAIPSELGPSDLPQEAGLEALAVSFTKGCYLGQEVMARLHAMGTARRRMVRVSGEGPPPTPGTPLTQDGRELGELRAAVAESGGAGWLGLAMLKRLGLAAERPLRLPDSREASVHEEDRA